MVDELHFYLLNGKLESTAWQDIEILSSFAKKGKCAVRKINGAIEVTFSIQRNVAMNTWTLAGTIPKDFAPDRNVTICVQGNSTQNMAAYIEANTGRLLVYAEAATSAYFAANTVYYKN